MVRSASSNATVASFEPVIVITSPSVIAIAVTASVPVVSVPKASVIVATSATVIV